MADFSFGVSAMEMGDINATTGLGENFADIGKVYKNSAVFSQSEGTTTEHYEELSQDPVVQIDEKGKSSVSLQIMDVRPDNIVKYAGGTVTAGTSGSSPDIWNAPRGIYSIEKAFKFTTEDGRVLTINRGKIVARPNFQLSTQGIYVFDVTVTVLNPVLGSDLPPYTWTDNENAA